MDSERFDATGDVVEQHPLKPDTNLQLDIIESSNNNNLDDTPPAMIIVETCINSIMDNHVASILQTSTKQMERESCSTIDSMDQAACSITLGLKPNVQFNRLPQNAAQSAEQLLSSTEAALVAANISCATTEIFTCNNESLPIVKLQRCADGATQCNNLNLDCEACHSSDSMSSIGSLVCRICHNAENPEQLVSPCLCKGSLTYVHVHCLERWISTSRCTICELCQFHYNTEQTLRYTFLQSLRLWYSRAMSRRALQEDCQMFSLLTLVAFGIIGTLLVGIQYYALHTQSWGLSKLWTKSWMLFFLLMTITVYVANVYMLVKSQLTPWYRWWQSARDIKLILENRRPFPNPNRLQPQTLDTASVSASMFTHHDQLDVQRRSSQPTFVTPSSSALSLPRIVVPPAPPTILETEKEVEAEVVPLQMLTVSNSTEEGIELALLGNNLNPNSDANPKSNDGNALTDDGNVAAVATVEEEEQEKQTQGNDN